MSSDYKVGYGKPPESGRFKKGVCPNRKGRGRRREFDAYQLFEGLLNASIEFRDRGKLKKGTRMELTLKKITGSALNGDVNDAALLLRLRAQFGNYGDVGPSIVTILNSLPEFDDNYHGQHPDKGAE